MIPLLAGAAAIVNSRIHAQKKQLLFDHLSKLSIPYKETQYAGDAAIIARKTEAPVIIASGGDGTVNEVLNGMNVDKQKLLIVPAGTLNVISHAIGNSSIDKVFTLVEQLKEVDTDFLECILCQCDGTLIQRRVLGFVACGYDGRIVKYASGMKPLFPALRYILAGWIAFCVNRPFKASCVVNGVKSERVITSVMINNCGAAMFSTIKKYSVQDQLLEIKYINLPYIFQLTYILLCKVWYNGGYQHASSVELDWKKPIPVMADGELFENIVSIAVKVKSGLKLICAGRR
jgi:diacylglycerol kinase family enzyme